ncbi:hypothetical protein [Natronococcus occultus]|uniref:Uncharacterized protein n=1 Tax=Natronococcus occultus SP4 TaxID=694430 RepID=L0K1Y8_9EURY|nr:hypothetical protein [Natronococcus occultus]AGB38575.1 hypothetical protein Natoc_2816 [Natronococcus occultus SP4]
MTSEHDRRRFLQLTGTSAAAALAGCADLNPLSDDGGEYDDVLTAVVGPSTAEIEELQEQVAEEELDMAEAQQRQQELVENAIDDFEARAEDDDGLEIEDASAEYGLYRIDGDAETIVDELKGGSIASLSEGAAYDRILEEQEQQPAPEEIDPEEEEIEPDEEDADDENGADEEDADDENGADEEDADDQNGADGEDDGNGDVDEDGDDDATDGENGGDADDEPELDADDADA